MNRIFIFIILGLVGLFGLSFISSMKGGKYIAEMLIIFGIILFILVLLTGFKDTPAKLWWE